MVEMNRGYRMMNAMGWEKNTPLGIRGEGIVKPVEVTEIRKGKDTRGLGFEWGKSRVSQKRTDDVYPPDGTTQLAVVKVVSHGGDYCVGTSYFGSVYIPGGAARHMCNVAKCSTDHLLDKYFRVTLTSRSGGRHPWRVVRV
jgi:hypothetical protein